jgi:hypothetical protein
MKRFIPLAAAIAIAVGSASRAQTAPTTGDTVSRAEYDRLKQEQDEMRKELEELKRQRAADQAAAAKAPTTGFATQDDLNDVDNTIKLIKKDLERQRIGTSQFFIAGDADVGFVASRHSPSTFEAGLAPLILWRPTDRILVEGAFDIGIDTDSDNNSSTSFDLTIANISFLLNDNLAVGGGLFVVPFGVYHNHFDPPWINKFPDDPLPFGDGGIAPGSEVGFYVRGASPLGSTKITYDAYVTNGPNLHTTGDNAGQLNFDDFTDLNNNKAVGGRIGFLPFPNVEMGYSIQFAQVDPDGFQRTDALLQAVDLNVRQSAFGGVFDLRTEWVWSNVEETTYQLDSGPDKFPNNRDGGYVQLCYRPTKSDIKFVRDLELVTRYDYLRSPLSSPGGEREQRLAIGVDYWITPAIVLKTAYEFDDKKVGENADAFLMQIGIGL